MTNNALTVRVLDLETLIRVKASTGRGKDRLIVPILLALQDTIDEESRKPATTRIIHLSSRG